MLRLILGRIAAGAATLLVASALIFTATQLLPGDLATATLGRDATPDAVKQLRETLGLDRPAALRYVDWLEGIAHLDLGKSAVNQRARQHDDRAAAAQLGPARGRHAARC